MPPRPQPRSDEISDELMSTFDRVLTIRALIAKLQDELKPLNKRLEWTLMPKTFGDHWGPHNMMSARPTQLSITICRSAADAQIAIWRNGRSSSAIAGRCSQRMPRGKSAVTFDIAWPRNFGES